jgi:hypothetical protein
MARFATVVLAILAVTSGLSAQLPTAPPVTVIGQVVDSVSGAPIGTARVSLGPRL